MAIALAHAASTWMMVGVIWLIQLNHYPLMALVGPDGYIEYQRRHMRLISFVVGPPMLVEGITMLAIAAGLVDGVSIAAGLGGLVLGAVAYGSTALWFAPAHGRLSTGFDADLHRRLVHANWIRTVAWTGRGAFALYVVERAFGR